MNERRTDFKGTLLQRPDSIFHVGAGMATAIGTPLLAVPYGLGLWHGSFDGDTVPAQSNCHGVVYGFEYAIGYFAVQYLYAFLL